MMVFMAWLAAALVFWTFFMKTIVPLRTLAIASNLAFIAYGLLGAGHGMLAELMPILVLHCALLPLNLMRLREVQAAIKAVRSMTGRHPTTDLLTPYMEALSCRADTVLFRRGDRADTVYVLKRGAVRIVEFDRTLPEGELFGEIAIFAEDARRTATAVCDGDCELYRVSGQKILELFYQDQRFAFEIARRLSRYV